MPGQHIEGVTLEYVERGNGTPLVFVHGSAGDLRTWQAQLDHFSPAYRCVAYSRRYHWPNEKIPDGADYSMLEHVADLQEFLQLRGCAPAQLVGHSYGAFVCLLLAIRRPDLVRTLVLAEPPVLSLFVSTPPRGSEMLRLLLSRPRTAFLIMKFGATGISPAAKAARRGDVTEAMHIFGKAVLGAAAFRALTKERLMQVEDNAIRAEFLGSGFVDLDQSSLRSMNAPTLILCGEKSPKLFHHLAKRVDDLLPHSEFHEVSAASHMMHEDNPAVFNRIVEQFLARASTA